MSKMNTNLVNKRSRAEKRKKMEIRKEEEEMKLWRKKHKKGWLEGNISNLISICAPCQLLGMHMTAFHMSLSFQASPATNDHIPLLLHKWVPHELNEKSKPKSTF